MARTPPGYYLHLIAWAQIGVVIRVYFAALFGSACPGLSWAPCLTSSGSRYGGAFFTDLPSNILGCFLMGLLVSSDVLSNSLKHILTVEAPMAMLPVRSPLQEHMAFQVGLRTGLCGSLTTFASWLTQKVLMIVGGHNTTVLHHTQWVEALGGLLIGTIAALAALVMGQHCALLLYHKLNPGAFIPYSSPAPEQNKLEGLVADPSVGQQQRQRDGEGFAGADEGGGEGLGRQLRTVSSTQRGSFTVVVVDGGQQQQQQQQQQIHAARLQSLGLMSLSDGRLLTGSIELAGMQRQHSTASSRAHQHQQQQQQQQRQGSITSLHSVPSTAAAGGGGCVTKLEAAAAAAAAAAGHSNGGADSSTAVVVSGVDGDGGADFVEEVDEVEAPSVSLAQWLVDGFAVVTIIVLTGISLWRIIQGSRVPSHLQARDDPFSQEWFWWSILFGPLGCYGRYYLSRYNGKLPGDWQWFPAGTFAANIAACVIDYVMKLLPVRLPLDSVSLAVLAGVVGGVGGCLSTVSTWVVEVQRLLLSFPKTSHGYQYVGISLGTALLLGLLVYGIPVWTM